ncbi:MAG: hypothetical protein ABEH77_08715 [Halobacteriaceae archaeon]
MERTSDESARRVGPGVYLPAMPSLSTTPGRVERFLTTLLRRRGRPRIPLR